MSLAFFDQLPVRRFSLDPAAGSTSPTGPTRQIVYRLCGEGPPLLLLHGYPQSGMMWAETLPALSAKFTCVVPDLRGYGDSFKPARSSDHADMSFRAMAADQAQLMRSLGFGRYGVVGHDRGARTAHRLALDHSASVERLMLLDITPTLDLYETLDQRKATAYFHWLFLPQPWPLPEKLISNNEVDWVNNCLDRWSAGGRDNPATFFSTEQRQRYTDFLRAPACLEASTEDYRAGASIDLEHDRHSRALGEKIACPTRVHWGAKGLFAADDVVGIWRARCHDGVEVDGSIAPTGHFIPEEAPEFIINSIATFFA